MSDTKFLSEKNVFQSKYFRINQIVVERDNGKQFTKDVVERNSVVYIVAVNNKDEIYLISQQRDALKAVTLEVVAGTIESEQGDALETAKRELHEEAGLTAKTWKKIGIFDLGANMVGKAHVFFATDLEEGTPHPDDDEDMSVVKMPFTEALKKILAGEMTVIPSMAMLLLVDSLRKENKL